jgi:hypothetical protein
LLDDGDKGIEIVYGEEKIFCTGQPAEKPNEPLKEGSLSCVLFESPFTSVSTAGRGHPSLASLRWSGRGCGKGSRKFHNFALSLFKKRN